MSNSRHKYTNFYKTHSSRSVTREIEIADSASFGPHWLSLHPRAHNWWVWLASNLRDPQPLTRVPRPMCHGVVISRPQLSGMARYVSEMHQVSRLVFQATLIYALLLCSCEGKQSSITIVHSRQTKSCHQEVVHSNCIYLLSSSVSYKHMQVSEYRYNDFQCS